MHRSTMFAMNFIFPSMQVQTASGLLAKKEGKKKEEKEKKEKGEEWEEMGKKRERERERERNDGNYKRTYWRGVERRKRKADPFAGAARF